MIDILPDELPIWEAYNFSCVVCKFNRAVCLHEEPPKSLNPNWEAEPWNRFPVCNDCHNHLHSLSRKDAGDLLKKGNDVYARISNVYVSSRRT